MMRGLARREVIAQTELRIVVIGSSGPSQFLLTNYILGREEFTKDVCSIAGCRKNVGELAGRQVAVVNAPNLYDEELSKSKMREELRRTKCLSSPGPHAILIAFDLEKISPNDIQTPKLVMKYFGESVLNYAMVLLAYDGHLGGAALNDRIMKTDWHLRELIEQCNCCYHIFSKNWRNRSKDRELLQKLERMIGAMGGRCYTSSAYRKAEESVRKEEKKLMKKRAPETERAWRELEKQYQGEELRWQMDAYNSSVGAEIRAKAELDNSWLRTSLAMGFVLGFAAGATMGMVVGSVEGLAGMAVGGTVGGAVGGAAGSAVQSAIEHLDERVGPHANNFNSAFMNRFFRTPRV
ncbi:GTPase IMAP family member 9 [Pygocentrus nattereri]|uniref:GTPase IMAP family member 9 n=1 Tax=Pygocentrus nattereri TaxID=42514 RepID=UPI000814770E|nr:GTPase IMAP family member 9 [Pygocentrus nattereri]